MVSVAKCERFRFVNVDFVKSIDQGEVTSFSLVSYIFHKFSDI